MVQALGIWVLRRVGFADFGMWGLGLQLRLRVPDESRKFRAVSMFSWRGFWTLSEESRLWQQCKEEAPLGRSTPCSWMVYQNNSLGI